jgi:hypothetical protein
MISNILGLLSVLVFFCLALIAAGGIAKWLERWDRKRIARRNKKRLMAAYAARRAVEAYTE